MGPLGGVQGLVFGAAPRVENPFPADPLPRVRLGLLPAAVNLGRERKEGHGWETGHVWEPGVSVAGAWRCSPTCFALPEATSRLFTAPLTRNKKEKVISFLAGSAQQGNRPFGQLKYGLQETSDVWGRLLLIT